MTWTRLDDTWTDQPALADLTYADRWHYLTMIQFCSRTKRYDGVFKMSDARRCSDIDDPARAIQNLASHELLTLLPDNMVKVGSIDEHIPPPSVRQEAERAKIRKRRSRAHKDGDHSMCLPENCDKVKVNTSTGEVTSHVTRDVTSDIGTGQDRTGQDYKIVPESDSERDTVTYGDAFDFEAEMYDEKSELPGSGEKSPDPQPWAALTYYGGAAS